MAASDTVRDRDSGAPSAIVAGIVALCVFAGAWVWISATIPARPAELIGDEIPWIRHGHTLLPRYLRLDWFDPIWADALDDFGSRHPRVGLYVVAAVDTLAERLTGDRVRNVRRLMSLISAAAVAVLFFGAARRWSWGVGATAAALLLLHPAFSAVSTFALPEVPLLLFAALAMGASGVREWFTRSYRPALFGLWAGLATGCRLHGASLAIAGAVLALTYRAASLRDRLRVLAILAAATAAAFVLSNPLLLTRPVEGVREMSVGHLRSIGTAPDNFNTTEAADLAYAMLTVFDPEISNFYGYVPTYRQKRSPYALIGAALLIAGLWRCRRGRDVSPAVFAAVSAALCVYVGAIMLPVIKNALPAVVCLAWLQAQAFRARLAP